MPLAVLPTKCPYWYGAASPKLMVRVANARPLFRHVLGALRHAHRRGFLHCDLKPANIRLQEEPNGSMTAIVVDWGLARQTDRQPACLTMGTPQYASPEQLTGYNADVAWGRAKLGPPADVWSLGATLYEMLAGKSPFGGKSHEALVANALALNYELPDEWSLEARQLVDEMLQVLPSDRASIDQLCFNPWTTASLGPMPPDADTVEISVKGDRRTPSPSADEAFGSRGIDGGLLGCTSESVKRYAMYLLYAGLIAFALVHFNVSHGGTSAALDLVEET